MTMARFKAVSCKSKNLVRQAVNPEYVTSPANNKALLTIHLKETDTCNAVKRRKVDDTQTVVEKNLMEKERGKISVEGGEILV